MTSAIPRRKVLLYGDVNLNITDGSAIWLVSMAEALSKTNSDVTVLLKAKVIDDRLSGSLYGLANVRVESADNANLAAGLNALSSEAAAQRIAELDAKNHYDVVVVRGLQVAEHVAKTEHVLAKSWLYITDLPFPYSSMTPMQRVLLTNLAQGAKRLFAQTEDARSYLEALIPEAAGKVLLLSPMIPDKYFKAPRAGQNSQAVSVVYSGKFARDWRTLEMCSLPAEMSASGAPLELTMVGDKFQGDKAEPDWPERMRSALSRPGVTWAGGLSRDDATLAVSKGDIGLSWRASGLDSSLEISTKVLEYAAAGVAPLLNRTRAHEEIFGSEYPLFLEHDSPGDVRQLLTSRRAVIDEAKNRAHSAVRPYSVSASAQRLETYLTRAGGNYASVSRARRPTRVLLAGHDLKFAGELVELLSNRSDIELEIDEWTSLHTHDPNRSAALLEWADVIICEWAGPNAVWFSHRKRASQRLIVRLHAFELRGPWLDKIDIESIDFVVCVSDLYRQLTHERTGWPIEKLRVVPNGLDAVDFERPKFHGSRFRLGMVGLVPFIKRPDRALDVLEELISLDARYTLHLRGRMPWEYDYEWRKPYQREAYSSLFRRLGSSTLLSEHVVFEPFGADMASWFRKIGFILSPSTRESFHLAPAEGMASGSVPVFWDRPGVREIFGDQFVVNSSGEAAALIYRLGQDDNSFGSASNVAMQTAAKYDVERISPLWLTLVLAKRVHP
jgi:glycosyltransferase involved in cell wall biosynthesis